MSIASSYDEETDSNSSHQKVSISVDGKVITRRRVILSHSIFTFINFLNFTDRYTIAGVLSDIQNYFKINDTQGGLIQTVFILVFMCFAPLFGYLGDRITRKCILIGGILAWSFFTLMGSFVGPNNFWVFLLLRGLVGVGESSYITVSPSLIGDLFSESERIIALSVFSLASPFGAGFGYILGSLTTSIAKDSGADDDSAWKWSLRITPILGLISNHSTLSPFFICVIAVILTVLVVPEPMRGSRETSADNGVELKMKTSMKDDVIYLITGCISNKTAVFVTLACTANVYVVGCLAFWAPVFIEEANLAQGENPNNAVISFGFGAVTCASGVLGVVLGAFTARFFRRRTLNAEPLVGAYGLILAAPMVFMFAVIVEYNTIGIFSNHFRVKKSEPTIIFNLQTNKIRKKSLIAIWPIVILGEIGLCLNMALVPKILIDCVVPNRRSLASGISTGFTHIFGDAYSPFFVGLLADVTYGSSSHYNQFKGLQLGVLTCPIASAIGTAAFFACAIAYEGDHTRTAEIVDVARRGRMENGQERVSPEVN
ncbi:protein spinster homolog 1-like [Symsagittifera roscoffensis]|uniref:protein spinster homolog 1-like n=1 Tax=Symsagittifera roscoffensis TaxID=84072 RepID=UPI00307BAA4A